MFFNDKLIVNLFTVAYCLSTEC